MQTMIDVARRGPCSFAMAKYHTYHSVKAQKGHWIAKEKAKTALPISEATLSDL